MDEREIYEKESQRGEAARQVIKNPAFNEAVQEMYDDLEDKAQTTPTTDVETCADIIRCKQLMRQIEKNLVSFIQTGEMANDSLKDFEKSRKKPDKYT